MSVISALGQPSLGPGLAYFPPRMTEPLEYFNDFAECGRNNFSATVGDCNWTVGGANAAVTSSTILASTLANGKIRITTTGVSGDGMYLQLSQAAMFTFSHSTTAPQAITWQHAAIIETITTVTHWFGMHAAAAVSGATTPNSAQATGFAFVVSSGTCQIQYKTSVIPVATVAVVYEDTGLAVTFTANQYVTFRVEYDGQGGMIFYVNGRVVKRATLAAFTTSGISPVFGIETGAAATRTFTNDYVKIRQNLLPTGRS